MIKTKTGVIVRFADKDATCYHNGGSEHNRIPVLVEGQNKNVFKADGVVTVSNKHITVSVYPDGRIETELHDQVKSVVEEFLES